MSSKKHFINMELVRDELIKLGIDNVEEKLEELDKQIKKNISKYRKKPTIAMQQYESGVPFASVYENTENFALPEWILNNISEARLIGNSLQTIILPNGEKYQINNTLNNLSGGDWINFTTSVFSTAYLTIGKDSYAHEIRKIHPTPKPPQLMKNIIEFFTKENESVFDYFMGVGGSLLGAGLCNRKAIGIDLNQKYIDAYKQAATKIDVEVFPTVCGDCIEILQDESIMQNLLQNKKASLVLIDPPYGNMMSKEKTGADINVYGNIATPFTDDKRDFGNMSLDDFFISLKKSIELILPYLKEKGYIVIFIKDLQPVKKNTNLLHSEIIKMLNEIKTFKL